MSFLGVDQSLNASGVCLLEEDGRRGKTSTIELDPSLGDKRLVAIRQRLALHVKGVRLAAMEGYSFQSTHRAFDLGEVGGVVKTLLLENEVPYVVVPPATLKLFATGSGSASKDDMLEAARRLGATPTDDNQADAFFLARVAWAYVMGASKRSEMEAIRSLQRTVSGKHNKPIRRARSPIRNAI